MWCAQNQEKSMVSSLTSCTCDSVMLMWAFLLIEVMDMYLAYICVMVFLCYVQMIPVDQSLVSFQCIEDMFHDLL